MVSLLIDTLFKKFNHLVFVNVGLDVSLVAPMIELFLRDVSGESHFRECLFDKEDGVLLLEDSFPLVVEDAPVRFEALNDESIQVNGILKGMLSCVLTADHLECANLLL